MKQQPGSKTELGWKVLKIVNPRSAQLPVLIDYQQLEPGEEKTVIEEELSLLVQKFRHLKGKVNERIPLLSRRPEHKWFITKNKFGCVYFMLTQIFFEEKLVFKIQTKIDRMLDHYFDQLSNGDGKMHAAFKQRVLELMEQYNSTVSKTTQFDVPISEGESVVEVVQVDSKTIDLHQKTEAQVPSSTDKDDIFYQIEKRQQRLFTVQLVCILATIVAIALGVLDLLRILDDQAIAS